MSNAINQPKPAARTRILLVEDHSLLRRGLRNLIESEPGFIVCGEAATRLEGLKAIAATQPDLVIADLSLRDSDGLEMIKDIKQRFPHLPVLALSMHDEEIYAERTLRAGARGYLTKQEMDDTVLKAIRQLLAGEIYTSDAMSRYFAMQYVRGDRLGDESGTRLLSDRELEIFKLIGHGKTTSEIACLLNLSVKTIESHREHLKLKLKLPTGVALLRTATLWVETGRMD